MSWRRIAACSLALAWAGGPLRAQEATPEAAPEAVSEARPELRREIAGTGVSLLVPAGFEASPDFPGIGRSEDLSSVMVTELEVPLAIASEAFSAPALARRGIEVQDSAPALLDGREATLIEATQRIGGMSFRKWFLLLGNDTRSVLLTATTPTELEAQHHDALFRALASARWDETTPAAPALSFEVKEAAPLRIVRSGHDSIVLSDPEVVQGHVTPVVAVGASRAHVDAEDLSGFARARLEETVSIHEIAVESEGPRSLGPLPGSQIAATARDTESGRAVRVQQILASDGARYYLVQGIFDAEDAARLAPAFEAVASSFALRGASGAPAGGGPASP